MLRATLRERKLLGMFKTSVKRNLSEKNALGLLCV